MSEGMLFKYGSIEMNAIIKDGVPMLPAKEVCQMLGIKNVSAAVSRLKENEKDIISNDMPKNRQMVLHVTETGLYRLIFSSRKAEAEKFKDWVFEEVLPKIRRTGVYNLIEEQEQTIFGKAMIRTIYGIETEVLNKKEN